MVSLSQTLAVLLSLAHNFVLEAGCGASKGGLRSIKGVVKKSVVAVQFLNGCDLWQYVSQWQQWIFADKAEFHKRNIRSAFARSTTTRRRRSVQYLNRLSARR